jgi:hypothetical protein
LAEITTKVVKPIIYLYEYFENESSRQKWIGMIFCILDTPLGRPKNKSRWETDDLAQLSNIRRYNRILVGK